MHLRQNKENSQWLIVVFKPGYNVNASESDTNDNFIEVQVKNYVITKKSTMRNAKWKYT
jgi:hypothetical protein